MTSSFARPKTPKDCIVVFSLALALSVALAGCASPNVVRVSQPATENAKANVEVAQNNREQALPAVALAVGTSSSIESPKVYALDLLPSSMLSGPNFEVGANVSLQGHMAAFAIKSDYGRLDSTSVEMLQVRIHELAALAELERMSELKVFGKAAANSLRRTGTALYNVFRNPEATAKAIPDSIRAKASNAWESLKVKTKELGDDARARWRGDSGLPEYNAFMPDPLPQPEKTWEERAQSQGQKFGLDFIGYNSARRELTKTLQIDPYTSNPQIEDRLDAFAWSYLAGGKAAGMTLGAITGGASFVVSRARQINRLVYELTPEDLRKHNRAELKKIGIDGEDARNFIRNRYFTPTLQTQVVDFMVRNWEVKGWRDYLRYLRFVDSELEARYTLNALAMSEEFMAGNQQKGVLLVGATPVFEAHDGTYFIAAPVDFVYFNQKLKDLVNEPQLRGRSIVLWVSGSISEFALEQLQASGWRVQAGIRYANAPEYAEAIYSQESEVQLESTLQ